MAVTVQDIASCTECRACMLACSFHHLRAFAPYRASIQVVRNEENNHISVRIHESSDGVHLGCDSCAGTSPQCVAYCPREVLA